MSWIQTFSGQKFYPANPTPDSIRIMDIARPLSLICRFAGQIGSFYSVAQHSVYCAWWLLNLLSEKEKSFAESVALLGLLHDGAEAYIGDIPRPVKMQFNGIKVFEERLLWCIYKSLAKDLSEDFIRSALPYIKAADNAMLGAEARDLLTTCVEDWNLKLGSPPAEIDIKPCSPKEAEFLFLEMYYRLSGDAL